MYTIKKSESFHDSFQIVNSKNETLIIDFEFDVTPENVKKFRTLQTQYIDLQKSAADDAAKLADLGECIVALFTLIFGEANIKSLLEFYKDDYSKMLVDIAPYIREVIIPAINKRRKQTAFKFTKRF